MGKLVSTRNLIVAVLLVALLGAAAGALSARVWPPGEPGPWGLGPTPTPTATPTGPAPTESTPAPPPGTYSYRGPADLCTVEEFPEAELIKEGAPRSEATLSAEYALIALDYDGVSPDGLFGPADADALARFQDGQNIIADGSLGQESWAKLRQVLTNTNKC